MSFRLVNPQYRPGTEDAFKARNAAGKNIGRRIIRQVFETRSE